MKLSRRILLFALMAFAVSHSSARADFDPIVPTIDVRTPSGALPTITFDNLINPLTGTSNGSFPTSGYSQDALNIINSHRVAMQQVQAALLYLRTHRASILAGHDARYNQIFGDFYNPNSAFAGQYDRTILVTRLDQFGRPLHDRFGHLIQDEKINTEHFDLIYNVFSRIQQALNAPTTYNLGAQSDAASQLIFDTYGGLATANSLVGDPLFGNGFGQANLRFPLSPLPPTVLTLANERDVGVLQWGDSPTYTPIHRAQVNATKPTVKQLGDFVNDRLDIYSDATAATSTNPTASGAVSSTIAVDNYVGGAFLNERIVSGSSTSPTEFRQYQLIISALAHSVGTTPLYQVTDTTVTTKDFGALVDYDPTLPLGFPSTATLINLDTKSTVTTYVVSVQPPATATGGDVSTPTFTPTTLNAIDGVVRTMSTLTRVVVPLQTALYSGLLAEFGDSAYFLAALDAGSYGRFADLFASAADGGFGDGSLLPPPGKNGTNSQDAFDPVVPGGFSRVVVVPDPPPQPVITPTSNGSGSGSSTP
jgi:hypothetical protein